MLLYFIFKSCNKNSSNYFKKCYSFLHVDLAILGLEYPYFDLLSRRPLKVGLIFTVGTSDDAFTKSGYSNWKNAAGEKGKLAKHANSRMHMLSLERRHNFMSATPIDVQLNDAAHEMRARKEKERIENRHIVETIFDVVRHLAKQNIAFRGHDESTDSKNRGHFLEELEPLTHR